MSQPYIAQVGVFSRRDLYEKQVNVSAGDSIQATILFKLLRTYNRVLTLDAYLISYSERKSFHSVYL